MSKPRRGGQKQVPGPGGGKAEVITWWRRPTLRQMYLVGNFLPLDQRQAWRELVDGLDDPTAWWRSQEHCRRCGMPVGWCTALCTCAECLGGASIKGAFVQGDFVPQMLVG